MNYIAIDVEKDGNCYYRCLSFYRKTQDYHLEFRKLISEIFENNLDKFTDHYPNHNILGIPEPDSEDEINKIIFRKNETTQILCRRSRIRHY